MKPKGSLPCSQELVICSYSEQRIPYQRPYITFRNKLLFFTVSCSPKLGDHPFSAVLDCISSYSPHLEAVSSIRKPRMSHAVVTGTQNTTMSSFNSSRKILG